MTRDAKELLFAVMSANEEEQVTGGFTSGGFRMHTSRVANVPVANVSISPQSAGGGYGSGYGSGFFFNLQSYIFGMGAAYLFGNPGVTPAEVQYVWQMALKL